MFLLLLIVHCDDMLFSWQILSKQWSIWTTSWLSYRQNCHHSD